MAEAFTVTRTFQCNELIDTTKASLMGANFTFTIGRSQADHAALRNESGAQSFACKFILNNGTFRSDGIGVFVSLDGGATALIQLASLANAGQANQSLNMTPYVISGLAYSGVQSPIQIGLFFAATEAKAATFSWVAKAAQLGADSIGKTTIAENLSDIMKTRPSGPIPTVDTFTPVLDYVNESNKAPPAP